MSDGHFEYQQKNMPFRLLGSSGLRVPVFALGGWLTFGGTVSGDPVKEIVRTALENGINMFDEAENYTGGESEKEIGRVLEELKVRRSDIILTSKVFFGTRKGPNDTGLSRKHIIEGVRDSLARLRTDYLDIIFAHRPDTTVPMLETVRAFSWVIDQGMAFYWGTSEWSAKEFEEACLIAEKHNLHAPVVEQCMHNIFHRERPEKEYAPLYERFNVGTTVYSALASGMLTGKYNDGIPENSRFHTNKHLPRFAKQQQFLQSEEGQRQISIVRALTKIAEEELGCSMSDLALAWVIRNPNTSSLILGASSPSQIIANVKALDVMPKLTPEILARIDEIAGNKPVASSATGRPALCNFGRSS
ncbi:Aldo/keto reductase [Peniophora sp. CONT]|nr:Aldo/keto reductase [Peniophora sp. CONT]